MNTIEKLIIDMDRGYCSGYYSAAEAVHRGSTFAAKLYFLIGQRRIGKTTFFLHLACRLWLEHGIKTAWIRSRKEEWKLNHGTFLQEAYENEWCPPEWISKPAGVFVDGSKGAEKIISFLDLNTASNMRGGAHPDTYLMVLDEFQPEDLRYPPHPLTHLLSLTQTVLSGKEGSMCFCLSNFVSLANPYFVGLDIYPERTQYSSFQDKGIVIERCRGYRVAIEKENPWMKVYNAGGYQKYASENEDGLIDLIKKLPKGQKPRQRWIYLLRGKYYREFEHDGITWWVRIHNLQGSNWEIYTPNPDEATRDVNLISLAAYRQQITRQLAAASLRFDDPNTLFAVMAPVYDI